MILAHTFRVLRWPDRGVLYLLFFFNVVVQCLAKIELEAQQNDLLVGLVLDIIDKGVVFMQYVDDNIVCITHDPEKAINLKLLLYLFELMSRLKINYQK
jgi:hypothetical protein